MRQSDEVDQIKPVDRTKSGEDISTHDGLINAIMFGMPESWGGDEGAESLVLMYVETIEQRLLDYGGTLERWENDE